MNKRILSFVIALLVFASYASCAFANVTISDYVLPEPVRAFTAEDFFGVWRVTYLGNAVSGATCTIEDFIVEAKSTGQTSISLDGKHYDFDSLGPDYCRVFGSNPKYPIYSFEFWLPFVGAETVGYRFEDGHLVLINNGGEDVGVYELLSDGNMWYYRFDDLDLKQVYVHQELAPDTNPRNIASPAAS